MTTPSTLAFDVKAGWGSFSLAVSLEVTAAPLVLLGPNGAGKTSLMLLLLGLKTPREGTVTLSGERLFDSAARVDVPTERRAIGYMPQDDALFPHLSAQENVAFAIGSRHPELGRAELSARARSLLADLEAAQLAERRPAQLSGGERQKVALARALGAEPKALLLDEPLAALDATARGQVRAFLFEHLAALRLPAIVVTHDPEDARALGGRAAVLEAGRLVQEGALDELRAQPKTAFVAQFTGALLR